MLAWTKACGVVVVTALICWSSCVCACALWCPGNSWGSRFETLTSNQRWHFIDGNPDSAIAYDLDSANVTLRRQQVDEYRNGALVQILSSYMLYLGIVWTIQKHVPSP